MLARLSYRITASSYTDSRLNAIGGFRVEEYKGWTCYEEIPDGWRIDKTAGSPIHSYEFITNGKSILSGGKRALARVYKTALRVCTPEPDAAKTEEKKQRKFDKNL